jgi:hypothetical protein
MPRINNNKDKLMAFEEVKEMSVIHIVGAKCPPEMEDEFNKWYSEKHVPDLLKFRNLKKVSRYEMIGASIGLRENPVTPLGAKDAYPKFLTVYEFDDREAFERYENSPEAVVARIDGFPITERLGVQLIWRVQYESIKVWE